jgi:hypothetical protein
MSEVHKPDKYGTVVNFLSLSLPEQIEVLAGL